MSNLSLVIEERAASIGNFMVGRLLPFRQKRAVGPFVFIDHMGPALLKNHENVDVPPHPHIGLSTLTWLFEGAMMHRDSIGFEQEIKPGEVNWMTAGKGVVHSERTPAYLRNAEKNLHGLQIWVALPKELEQCEPSFNHFESNKIPAWENNGIHYKLIAGELFGKKSPVPVHSKMYMLEIFSEKSCVLNPGEELFGESALYILKGKIKAEGNEFDERKILIANNSRLCSFEITAGTTVYLFGGEALPEERFMEWNFVSSDKELIVQAKKNWKEQLFPPVPGETDFVPLPERKV